jgi:hypothetical protein
MALHFVLDDRGEPRLERDLEAWTQWFEQADRRIARTAVAPHITVLTTFRGVDESPDAPRLFETRVFGGILNGEEVAHGTRADALAAHAMLAEWCRVGNSPNYGLTDDMLR